MKSFELELEKIRQLCNCEGFQRNIERMKRTLANKPLILYGAGILGVSTAKFVEYYGIKVSCFCDKNKLGIEEKTGLSICYPQALVHEYMDANIIICSINFKEEITRDLALLGIDSKRIYTREFFYIHEMTCTDLESYFNGYERVFDLLEDMKSKKIMLKRIQCYLTSSPIPSLPQEQQYFDSEIITLSDDEVFVDGGMYTGDTADFFFKLAGDNYRHYYGFEPDRKNFNEAYENLHRKPYITLISKGLWSCEGRLAFSGDFTSSSQLNETVGNRFVDVISLDLYFRDKVPPTFIKMDIEGAELEALKGAKHLISTYKPKLAICAYHKPEDLYTLLEQIRCYRDDYKFYLRHYAESIYETVLYAV